MAALSKILRSVEGNRLMFWCPGCDAAHAVRVGSGSGWTYNGNPDKPTFTPSILFNPGGETPGVPLCHSFVTDGRIQFLGDSTHPLAGQTVDLPDFDAG
ncbi:hypothetical protein J2847_005785 [Azospirillum agricola]|uniref:DUF6527 family protein n=1 Tax=Azospirillum agricola TaxID=1720247 RepID=UPI001F391C5E|nr:DUF6527 family protein [Azospirillum agricola]MBP2232456.1 hypothetical protein [Azospirillum agricola]